MPDFTFIFSGGSITESVWPSWKDFVINRYDIKNFVNNAFRGVGNEFLTESTIHHCQRENNPFALVMMTNADKWDWYVENAALADTITRQEKHPVRDVDGSTADRGFWSTGSWFPSHKQYYREHYYSEQYFMAQTLKNIFVLQSYFVRNSIPYLLLFDSPILSSTEQELNQGVVPDRDLVAHNALAQSWYQAIDWSHIFTPGLIGYCHQRGLIWFNDKIKGHPPAESHLAFATDIVFPELDKFLTVVKQDQTQEARRFQKMFWL